VNASSNWPRNRLLLALPSRNLNRLMPELEQIRCQRAQVLMNALAGRWPAAEDEPRHQKVRPAMNRKAKLPFDPKAFLLKVNGGQRISDYRKDCAR
jgi:hypothetical protein